MTRKISPRRARAFACLAVAVATTAACREATSAATPTIAKTSQVVQLNQGWSEREAAFYAHANEGTNLAPLNFLLNLPDPAKAGAKFVDKLSSDYGFIRSEK